MEEDKDWSAVGEVAAKEGEEHVVSLLENEAVFQGKALVTDSRVPGRILGHHVYYEALGAEPYIVQTVKEGYRLELSSTPPSSFSKNNRSAREQPQFVKSELLRLEKLGCVVRSQKKPYLVLPLSVVFSNKLRLVLDASRHLNPFCVKRGIKLDDLSHITTTIRQGDFMVVNDLDSGYWHVPVHESHWGFLGVHYVDPESGEEVYFVWKVLALGLVDAAHIFTRLNSPMLAALRRQGYRGQIYIDDSLTAAKSKLDCLRWERELYSTYARAGWVFKPEKRSGEPSQVCRFLGLVIDSRDMTFNIPEDKVSDIAALAADILQKRKVKVRLLARLVGKLQSVRLATGPIVSIMTRSLYVTVDTAPFWYSWVTLDELSVFELNWWKENIARVTKFSIVSSFTTTSLSFKEVAGDASAVGHFVYAVGPERSVLASRAFEEEEQQQSSTWRELKAFYDTWTNLEVLRQYAGGRVAHYTDSQAMASIVMKGSRNRKLQPMVMESALALRHHGIRMESVWRSREDGLIQWADRGSRDFHSDDISLDFESMAVVFERFGDFDVDCFASATNSKGVAFYSRCDVPGSAGMNFFHQSLKPGAKLWCFPPPKLLVQTVRHLANSRATAVIVVPVWPNSTFFSVFWPDGKHCASFVVDFFTLQPYFVAGPLVTSNGMRGRKSYFTAILQVDFSSTDTVSYSSTIASKFCLAGGCKDCGGR